MKPELDGEALLQIARNSVDARLHGHADPSPSADPPALRELGASFVTLTIEGRLRGCIGSIEPRRPLGEDLRHNACMAALRDPRFAALRPEELEAVRFGVSVLGPRTPLQFSTESEARAQLRPGVDGLILSCEGRRGVFLPQVWDQLPAPRDFLDQLKRKAGLPTSFWSPALKLERFEVIKFSEAGA